MVEGRGASGIKFSYEKLADNNNNNSDNGRGAREREQSQIVENWKDEVARDSRTWGVGWRVAGSADEKSNFQFFYTKCQTCRAKAEGEQRGASPGACAKNFDDSRGGRQGAAERQNGRTAGAALAFAPCSRWQVINHFNCHFRNTILSKRRHRDKTHRRKATETSTESEKKAHF